jgi:hypothetical protein
MEDKIKEQLTKYYIEYSIQLSIRRVEEVEVRVLREVELPFCVRNKERIK